MTIPTNDPRCGDAGGISRNGAPCRVGINLSPINGLCIQHDPNRAEEAAAMQKAGGAKRNEIYRRAKQGIPSEPKDIPKAPKTLKDAVRLSAWITRATLDGSIEVRVSAAATKALRQFQLSVEKRDLEKRIEELEARLKAAKAGGRA